MTGHSWDAGEAALPAWSLPKDAVDRIALPAEWPERVTREWALGRRRPARACGSASSTRASTRATRSSASSRARSSSRSARTTRSIADEDTEGDVSGHGTACAGIVRALAPGAGSRASASSGRASRAAARVLLAGLRYAIEQGFDVINMSLSTTKKPFASVLHELADSAYFRRTVLVASAHNMPVESYPWRFSSVISVGSHEEPDPLDFFYNPSPPVEFFGRGVNVEVPWLGGRTLTVSGNSFATPHMSCDLRADPREASRADALPAEERPLSDRDERRRCDHDRSTGPSRSRRRRRRRLRGVASARSSPRSSRSRARSSAPRRRRSSCSTRRPRSSCSRPSSARARTRSSARASPRARVSRAGCSRRARRSSSRTSSNDPRFASDVAEDTGYVPKGLMAAPLLHEEGALGVLSVLDRPEQTLFSLQEMELLGLFAQPGRDRRRPAAQGARGRALLGDGRRRARGRRAPRDRGRRARGRAARGGPPAPRATSPNARRIERRGPGDDSPGPLEDFAPRRLLVDGSLRPLARRSASPRTVRGHRPVREPRRRLVVCARQSLACPCDLRLVVRDPQPSAAPLLAWAVSLDVSSSGRCPRRTSGSSCRALDARFRQQDRATRPNLPLRVFQSARRDEMLRRGAGRQRGSGTRSPPSRPSGATRISAGSSSPGRRRSSGTTRSSSPSPSMRTGSAARTRSASSSSRGSSRPRSSPLRRAARRPLPARAGPARHERRPHRARRSGRGRRVRSTQSSWSSTRSRSPRRSRRRRSARRRQRLRPASRERPRS